jgi:fructokinase
MARDGALGPHGLAKADAATLAGWLAFAARAAASTCARRGADAPTLAELG